jgi:hypothetical protein
MSIRHSGTFSVGPVVVSLSSGPWNHAIFPPFGLGYGLIGIAVGTIEMSLVPGVTLVATTADGVFDVANAPPGFTPSTGISATYAGHASLQPGDTVTLQDVGVAGPGAAPLAIPDNRPWSFLRTDLFRLVATLLTAGTSQFVLHDPQTNGGFALNGSYDIIWYWWTIPDVDACGNRKTSRLAFAAEQPNAPTGDGTYQRLDPDDPDAFPQPVIEAIEPNHGFTVGGNSVTIRGSGFGEDCDVTFDGVSASDIVVTSQYEIHCTVPAHISDTVVVIVVNPDGVTS